MTKKKSALSAFILRPSFLSLLTGVLLTLSYPFPGWKFLAWVALIPLFYALRLTSSGAQALGLGYLAGFVFFTLSMHWLVHVTLVGWLLLAAFEALFFAVFAWLVFWGKRTEWPTICKILWTASSWTLTEFIRSEIPVFGFGWNLLAYSQAFSPVMIQSASLVGAYGLGFLIVMVNVTLAKLFRPEKRRERGVAASLFSFAVLIFLGNFIFGEWRLLEEKQPEEYLRVSVLQGNIPQSLKWAPVAREKIVGIYSRLSELASTDQTDLVIWPEASFPGYFNRDFQSEIVQNLALKLSLPMLIGGLHRVTDHEIYNSAYLMDKSGGIRQRYDKLHLVPFGEYIPLKSLFFWLTPIADALGISDFSVGATSEIFRWAREEWPFGVLICFEDVLPSLARALTAQGASFIAVITNDAWFLDTSAPFQHLQGSIFRAVENGVPVVRAANTGVSGFISRRGEVLKTVMDENQKKTFVTGFATYDLPLLTRPTVYRTIGWMFPYFVAGLLALLTIFMIRKNIHGSLS